MTEFDVAVTSFLVMFFLSMGTMLKARITGSRRWFALSIGLLVLTPIIARLLIGVLV